jgi:ATP-dependent DNA ligase
VAALPLLERKALLQPVVTDIPGLQFNGHELGDGELIRRHACQLGFEGIVSKTAAAPYTSGNRGLWRKAKCLNRQEFVVVGWTDPEGSRPPLRLQQRCSFAIPAFVIKSRSVLPRRV